MYYCPDCGASFIQAKRVILQADDRNDFSNIELICPDCGSGSIYIKPISHCRCCGSKLGSDNIEFCSIECRNKWLEFKKQRLKRHIALYNSPIAASVRRIDDYNNRHGTNLSYGKWTALQKMADDKNATRRKEKNIK